MDVSHILDSLNEPQRNAVASPASNLLVLAGAGSGKTRVLVHRIAWLMREQAIEPFAVLAVTTTNKAANEINAQQLKIIHGNSQVYQAGLWGKFDAGNYPADFSLELKIGAQVMFLKNDFHGRWVNGTLGIIKKLWLL